MNSRILISVWDTCSIDLGSYWVLCSKLSFAVLRSYSVPLKRSPTSSSHSQLENYYYLLFSNTAQNCKNNSTYLKLFLIFMFSFSSTWSTCISILLITVSTIRDTLSHHILHERAYNGLPKGSHFLLYRFLLSCTEGIRYLNNCISIYTLTFIRHLRSILHLLCWYYRPYPLIV